MRWIKPGPKQFQIEHTSGQTYEPDFIVESDEEKLIIEVKAKKELDDPVVHAKARAAGQWVKYANEFANENGDKTWAYLLVPGEEITQGSTLQGLQSRFQRADN